LLAFGIWTARFDWDNPREINSGVGGCLGTLATMAFIGVGAGLFVGLPVLASIFNFPVVLGILAGVVSGLAFCIAAGVVPLWAAQRKIPQLGEI
jgi:hypothetical protein